MFSELYSLTLALMGSNEAILRIKPELRKGWMVILNIQPCLRSRHGHERCRGRELCMIIARSPHTVNWQPSWLCVWRVVGLMFDGGGGDSSFLRRRKSVMVS